MEEKVRNTAILLGGGSGRRMGGDTRKQYLKIGGEPVLLRSLLALEKSAVIGDIVLVCPTGDEALVEELIVSPAKERLGATKVRRILAGGKERYDSVLCGLRSIDWPCDAVFIHDGARPFVEEETLQRLAAAAVAGHSCVAAVPSKDTVKLSDEEGYGAVTPPRDHVWLIQTPQVFACSKIRRAYEELLQTDPKERGLAVTDDAMVLEEVTGEKSLLVMGSYENIKITTPKDLDLAEAILARRRRENR